MALIYICQDGEAPSGVASYGYRVLAHVPGSRMLLLNASRLPPAAPLEFSARITLVPTERSHDPQSLSEELRTMIAPAPEHAVILPNTGDTPWSATTTLVRRLNIDHRKSVRVLGILHSDIETQYAGAERHAGFAAAWIAVSQYIGAKLRERIGRFGVPVHVLTYPVAVPERKAGISESGKLRIAYLGRLEEPQKRVSRLVSVFEKLAALGVPFEARIAGDGPARESFATAIAASTLAGNVRLLGAIDERQRDALLADSDVCVLTSAYEGMPLALLEAMAAGVCPVVMHVASGIDEIVHESEGVIAVPQGDVAAMAEALVRLHFDRAELERRKSAVRTRAGRDFSLQPHFAKLSSILDECWRRPDPDVKAVAIDATQIAVERLIAAARDMHRPVAVYGTGMFGRKVIDACIDGGLTISACFDSDPGRAGASYRGIACRLPQETPAFAGTLFLVGSLQFGDAIAQRIRSEFAQRGLQQPEILAP